MSRTNLYFRAQLETKVSLLPKQIDGNIDDHLFDNLKVKMEGKNIENGLVLKINNLISYRDGFIDKANLMGTTVFNVDYDCYLCAPTPGLEIICIIENDEIKGYLIGSNGPLTLAIDFHVIDLNKFEISDNRVINKSNKKAIGINDYVKVSIIQVRNTMGDRKIAATCKLINVATADEIARYKEEQKLLNNSNDTGTEKEFI